MPTTFGIVGKVSLTSDTSTISFTSLSGATHLFLAFNLKTNATSGFANESFKLTFNNSSGTTAYYGIRQYFFGTTVGADEISYSVSGLQQFYGSYVNRTSNSTSTTFGAGQIWIGNYANTTRGKTIITQSNMNVSSGTGYGSLVSGRWENTAAVTSIELAPLNGSNFISGSYAVLYALKD